TTETLLSKYHVRHSRRGAADISRAASTASGRGSMVQVRASRRSQHSEEVQRLEPSVRTRSQHAPTEGLASVSAHSRTGTAHSGACACTSRMHVHPALSAIVGHAPAKFRETGTPPARKQPIPRWHSRRSSFPPMHPTFGTLPRTDQ